MPKFDFEATGIGSLPFKDGKRACSVIFKNIRAIPFWPQLPKRSFREHMYCQFSENIPGIVIDDAAKTIHVDSNKAMSGMERAYQKFLDNDTEYFKISEGYAQGLYEFCDEFKDSAKEAHFVKGHITGPVSFALSVTDENKRSLIYDSGIFDIITKALCMKAKWQVRLLKKLGKDVIIFIDEPYLVSIGSSYVNIQKEDVIKALGEVNNAIKEEGAVSGVHCCGNTDWPMLLERGIDIINFDAYNFTREFSLYSGQVGEFLKNGGTIAWGIVPSSEEAGKESAVSLSKKLKEGIRSLSDKGVETGNISSLITPSCGLGTLTEKTAENILALAGSLSQGMERR